MVQRQSRRRGQRGPRRPAAGRAALGHLPAAGQEPVGALPAATAFSTSTGVPSRSAAQVPFQNDACRARSRAASSGSAAQRPVSSRPCACRTTHSRLADDAPWPPPSSSRRAACATTAPSASTGRTPCRRRQTGLAQFQHRCLLSRSPERRRRSRRSRGRAGTQRSPAGCSGTAWCGSAPPAPAGSASSRPSMPASSAIRSARIACHGSVTRTALDQPRSVERRRRPPACSPGCPRPRARRAARRRGRRRLGQVVAPGLGLGELVTGRLAADGHDDRRDAVLVQGEGVLQPRLEDRRRDAVVLRRAQHHDRVGRGPRVLPRRPPDRQRRRGDEQERGEHGGTDHPRHQAPDRTPTRHGYHAGPTGPGRLGTRRVRSARRARRPAPPGRPPGGPPARGTASRRRSPGPPRGRSAPSRGRRRARRRPRA